MDVKTHLKQICNLEQTLKETEMTIPKHKAKKTETEEKIDKKRKGLQADITEQEERISCLEYCRKSNANFVFEGTEKEKKITFVVCVITIIIQAIITAIIVACFGANNFLATSIVYTVIYTIFAVCWLHFEYTIWYKFPFFKTILGVIILAILYQITHWYFKTCNNIGVNIIGANIIFTLFVLGVEICLGARACKKATNAQIKEYNKNKKWLKDSEIKLGKLQSELKLKKQKLNEFNTTSADALAKMEADIISLEKFYVLTKTKLQNLYAQNVLHPNYQNWVAAATIYEYLDVGRCYELKGPDGAYNMYEKELMAKKILDSLSAINSSINYQGSRIYNSQTYIRSQLSECNRNVEQIVINTYGF